MGEFSGTPRQYVLDWLAKNVPESRLKHVLNVEQTAIELAHIHAVDTAKAAQAGLMHDLAKYFKPEQLLKLATAEGLLIDPVEEANPHLLHAEVGAIVARDTFGVNDPEILDAIANHTVGRPGMSPLSCVVYLADSLEPGRGNTLELNYLRNTSRNDLNRAVLLTCDYSLKNLIEKRRLIHPRALLTRNWFLQRANTGRSFLGQGQSVQNDAAVAANQAHLAEQLQLQH